MESEIKQEYSLIAKHNETYVELEMSENRDKLEELMSELVKNTDKETSTIEYMIVSSDEAYSLCKGYILSENIDN